MCFTQTQFINNFRSFSYTMQIIIQNYNRQCFFPDFKVSQKIKKDAAAKKKLSKKNAAEETAIEEVENDLEDVKMTQIVC